MGTPTDYRLRCPRLFVHRLGMVFLLLAVIPAVLALIDLSSRSLTGPTGIMFALWCAIFVAAAVWPVRVLAVTRQALWVRERLVMAEPRVGGASGRLRKLDWPDVVEVLLAPHRGRVAMIAGFRSYTGLRAVVADLPVRDVREVAEGISRVAPGTVIHTGERLSEILVHTGLPYVAERRPRRSQVLAYLVAVLGAGIIASVVIGLGHGEFAGSQVVIWIVGVRVWLSYSPVFVSPEKIAVRSRLTGRAVPWANVESVRLTATGDTGELTVRVAGSPRARALSQRLPHRTDLAEIDAIIRAYAPPHALRHGLPAE